MYRYIKLGSIFFFIVFITGVIFIYLKAKDIIPPIIRFKNLEYQQPLIQKSFSLVVISSNKDKYLIKVKDFYVYGLVNLEFPFKDFKRVKKSFVYNKEVGLKGNILPVYITINISNIKPINEYEFYLLPSEMDNYLSINKKRVVNTLSTFVYIKDINKKCGIVDLENKKKVVVCNIKRDINSLTKINDGIYLVSSLSIMKLSPNFPVEQIFKNKNLSFLNEYVEPLVISDIYLENSISEKIKEDFKDFVKTIFKLKKFNIKEVEFKTKG